MTPDPRTAPGSGSPDALGVEAAHPLADLVDVATGVAPSAGAPDAPLRLAQAGDAAPGPAESAGGQAGEGVGRAVDAAVDGASAAVAGIPAEVFWIGGGIVLLLAISAFFSGSETALTAASRAKLHGMADRGSKGAQAALNVKEDGERLIGSILLGNNISNILGTALATSFFTLLFGPNGIAWATLVMTALVVVFSEIAPKNYAISNPERAAAFVARPIALVVRLFAPVIGVVTVFVRLLLRGFGIRMDPETHALALDEIRGAIDLHHSEGAVEKAERDRLLAALDLREREVAEVMRHRRNIETIDASLPPGEILDFCLKSAHTRIPLWRDEPENIVGVIHAKDLLRAVHSVTTDAGGGWASLDQLDVVEVAMEPWFVPDTTSLDEQLRAFLTRRSHFALVVDEYGDLQGLITLEDILEEIVGDIADEHDAEVEGLTRLPDGALIVNGATTIRDFVRATDWALPDDEANTIAGLVIHEAQAIPSAGQIFSFHGFRFEVLERRRNQITRLKVKKL